MTGEARARLGAMQTRDHGSLPKDRAMPSNPGDGIRDSSGIRFSVVIPVLNAGRWLPATLAALRAQSLPRQASEIIAIDNGSTDDSVEILRREQGLRLLHEPRRDPYLTRNRGIEAACGEYVVFLDADCTPSHDWLANYAAAIDRSSADILVGFILFPARAPLLTRCYESYYNTKLEWLLAHDRTVNYFGHAGNMAIRRAVFATIGPFEAMPIVGDTEIIHRLMARDPRATIRCVPEARVVHEEVDSLRALLGKLVATGRYTQALVPRIDYLPVSVGDKLRIGIEARHRLPYGPLAIAPLSAMLACGWAAYLFGRLLAVVAPGDRPPRPPASQGTTTGSHGP